MCATWVRNSKIYVRLHSITLFRLATSLPKTWCHWIVQIIVGFISISAWHITWSTLVRWISFEMAAISWIVLNSWSTQYNPILHTHTCMYETLLAIFVTKTKNQLEWKLSRKEMMSKTKHETELLISYGVILLPQWPTSMYNVHAFRLSAGSSKAKSSRNIIVHTLFMVIICGSSFRSQHLNYSKRRKWYREINDKYTDLIITYFARIVPTFFSFRWIRGKLQMKVMYPRTLTRGSSQEPTTVMVLMLNFIKHS